MINKFMKMVSDEVVNTIEGLTGFIPEISLIDEVDVNNSSSIATPICISNVGVSGDIKATISMSIAPSLATAVSELMMGEEEVSGKMNMDEDDIDATKEFISNVFGAFSTALGGDKELPSLSFSINNITFLNESQSADFNNYKKLFIYSMKLQNITDQVVFAIDESLSKHLYGEEEVKEEQKEIVSKEKESTLTHEEARNIALIKDVKLPIRARIGSKKMLLKDVLNMDIGSVIELNQLANEPLDILIL